MRASEATQTIGAYVDDLENDIRPKAKGTFRLGRDRFEQKLRLEEGITLPVDQAARDRDARARGDAGRIPARSPAA